MDKKGLIKTIAGNSSRHNLEWKGFKQSIIFWKPSSSTSLESLESIKLSLYSPFNLRYRIPPKGWDKLHKDDKLICMSFYNSVAVGKWKKKKTWRDGEKHFIKISSFITPRTFNKWMKYPVGVTKSRETWGNKTIKENQYKGFVLFSPGFAFYSVKRVFMFLLLKYHNVRYII